MPFEAACRAADLLSRYRLYSSPRTNGAAEVEDEDDGERDEVEAPFGLFAEEAAARVDVIVAALLGGGVSSTGDVEWLLASFLIDAAIRSCATRRMYGHLLSTDAVVHIMRHDGEHVHTN